MNESNVIQQNGVSPSDTDAKAAESGNALGNAGERKPMDDKPVDFRYVPHGHGPCTCCGPYGE